MFPVNATERTRLAGCMSSTLRGLLCLGKWASPAYDTVDPRKAGHMAKTQSSHAYNRGLSVAVGKTATPYGKPIMRKI